MPRFGRTVIKRTARTPEQVMQFVETINHNIASREEEGFMTLKGHTHVLRIPDAVWAACSIRPSKDYHDSRMYRWDHEVAAAKTGWLWKQEKRADRAVGEMEIAMAQENDERDPLYTFA